ncbi:MAG TPA: 16S rRNA (uracil(1498)-N(3))-methyltransferase [Vicinamibacterales bacterium]|nr:16S rRNA (uracil(1498)-N(3))-methyltransferase [Vicinamibacterales bacterium]
MAPRFYVPEARASESVIELPHDEAAHLVRVLRLASGDRIRVFNGRGEEWMATVDQAGKRRVTARLNERSTPAPEARVPITLAVAVLKGDKMDHVIRDAVMLGVTAVQPLVTARTEIARAAIERSDRMARWQRIAVSSVKQCGRAIVPDVRPVTELDDVLREAPFCVMLVEPSASSAAQPLRDLPAREQVTLLVGPEGGWTQQEVTAAAERGAALLTLGPRTLRADAVPIVALTALRVHWEDD